MTTETTEKSKGNLKPWPKGVSGNPAGRPQGSRHKLQEDFLKALSDDFAANGVVAISDMRAKDPAAYVKTVASLMPKQVELNETLDVIGDAELIDVITALRSAITSGTSGKGSGKAGTRKQAEALQTLQ